MNLRPQEYYYCLNLISYSYLESVRSLLKLGGFHLDACLLEAEELLAVEAEHAGDLCVVVALHVPVHVSHDPHDGSAQGHGHLAYCSVCCTVSLLAV